ncbi:MAG: c(7)-type cytochrome triheme domain-containing protein [Nitrospirota bacterium]
MEEPLFSPEENGRPTALDYLPNTKKGYTDWVEALKKGVIKPRESILPENDKINKKKPMMPALDFNIFFKIKGDIPDVKFPHFPHTMWLDCRNCHPSIFLMQAGKNPITMEKILQGEFCGRCHGKVAFPISDCSRCHSVPK